MHSRPPRSTLHDTLFPYTARFRSRPGGRFGGIPADRGRHAAAIDHQALVGDRGESGSMRNDDECGLRQAGPQGRKDPAFRPCAHPPPPLLQPPPPRLPPSHPRPHPPPHLAPPPPPAPAPPTPPPAPTPPAPPPPPRPPPLPHHPPP